MRVVNSLQATYSLDGYNDVHRAEVEGESLGATFEDFRTTLNNMLTLRIEATDANRKRPAEESEAVDVGASEEEGSELKSDSVEDKE